MQALTDICPFNCDDFSFPRSRKKYKAKIMYSGTINNIGTFDTKKQAGMAYDRFVVDKSREQMC
jgi:hypothetical protein